MASASTSLKRTRTEALGYDEEQANRHDHAKARRTGTPQARAWKRPRDSSGDNVPEGERRSKRHCKLPTAGMPLAFVYYCINALLRRVHFERVTCRDTDSYSNCNNNNNNNDGCGSSGGGFLDTMDWTLLMGH